MPKDLLVISRTLFCDKCYKKGHPQKGMPFVVWGKTHKKYHDKKVHCEVGKRYWGFTPHCVIVEFPLVYVGSLVRVSVSCGVCEMSYEQYKAGGNLYTHARGILLSELDLYALLTKWTQTGYELI